MLLESDIKVEPEMLQLEPTSEQRQEIDIMEGPMEFGQIAIKAEPRDEENENFEHQEELDDESYWSLGNGIKLEPNRFNDQEPPKIPHI